MLTRNRPRAVIVLACFFGGVVVWNGLRLVEALVFWNLLIDYRTHPGPLYITLSGGFWLIAGLFLVWGIWQGKAWTWYAATGTITGYTLWYWFDRLVLQESRENWLFTLVVTLILLAFLLIVLLMPSTLHFFRIRSSNLFKEQHQ